jgi:ABC-type uncharacterized transport system involved in gliding motility auxiliary subunit
VTDPRPIDPEPTGRRSNADPRQVLSGLGVLVAFVVVVLIIVTALILWWRWLFP